MEQELSTLFWNKDFPREKVNKEFRASPHQHHHILFNNISSTIWL